MNENECLIAENIKKILPDEIDKIMMIGVFIGACEQMSHFIMQNCHPINMPYLVKDAIAITCKSILGFVVDPNAIKMRFSKAQILLNEQCQEEIFRRLKETVKELHDWIEESEKI